MDQGKRSEAEGTEERRRSSGRMESSLDLLGSARAGDPAALDALCERYLPRLRRWASGRLPRWARDLVDTDDLVQDTLLQTIRKVDDFVPRHEGALQAYLRQALQNRILMEIRRAGRRPEPSTLDSQSPDDAPSPLEQTVGHEALERYEAALGKLRPEDREAVVLRMEMNYSYEELARALDKPSANAARMAVMRAVMRLTEVIAGER